MSGTFQLSKEGNDVESENLVLLRPLSDRDEGSGADCFSTFPISFSQNVFSRT